MRDDPKRGSAQGRLLDLLRDQHPPIRNQADAQRYGYNVHSIAAARDRRDDVIWSLDWPDGGAAA